MKKFSLLPRKKKSDKRAYGHVFVLAGSRTYPGAAVLAATGALRAGAGLVTLGTARSARTSVLRRFAPEVMPLFFEETKRGDLDERAYAAVLKAMKARGANVAAIGPGFTRSSSTAALVRRLVRHLPVPAVLDAGGLGAFQGRLAELGRHAAPLVLTPHAGEFKRLFRAAWPASSAKRAALAKKLSRFYDVVLVLKSHRTLVAWRDRIIWNRTGNPGMATGGSGDVLTGVLAAFIAQGLEPFKAAAWAVHFHGKAGDLAAKKLGELSLAAGDLIDFLPAAFARH